ncbi:MAG: hypothetical protein PVSMB4_18310 [Ktedonobacterales bacterium]
MSTSLLILAVLAGVLGFLVGVMLLAALRDPLVRVVGACVNMLADLLLFVAAGVQRGAQGIRRLIEHALDALVGTNLPAGAVRGGLAVGTLIGVVLYLVLFSILCAGDYILFTLRLAALLNTPTHVRSDTLDMTTGVLWVAIVAVWTAALFDVAGTTSTGRHFANLDLAARHKLQRLFVAALVLTLAAAIMLWLWGQLAIDGIALPLLGWAFVVCFAVLLNAALVVAGWSLGAGLVAIYTLLLLLLWVAAWVIYGILRLPVVALRALAVLATALLDILASLGRGAWNWLCAFESLHLQPIGEWQAHPYVGTNPLTSAAVDGRHEHLGPSVPAVAGASDGRPVVAATGAEENTQPDADHTRGMLWHAPNRATTHIEPYWDALSNGR